MNSWKRWDHKLDFGWQQKMVCNLSFGATQMDQISSKPIMNSSLQVINQSISSFVLAMD